MLISIPNERGRSSKPTSGIRNPHHQALCRTPQYAGGTCCSGQLVRAGTSPGAQYREACRSRSRAEFISKVESAQQELDETDYWLLIIQKTAMLVGNELTSVRQEAEELIRILAASANTAKGNR